MYKNRFTIWKNRPDSEHEQAIIRILVGLFASSYVLLTVWLGEGAIENYLAIGIAVFFIFATGIIIWIIRDPGVNVLRRIAGCFLDNLSATLLLFLNGDLVAPIFIVYLWVAFGNGFRFGKRYLFLSMFLSVSGFCLVLFLSNRWSVVFSINIGLLVGLIALPLYVAALLSRLESALFRAEAANRAKSNFLATMSHEIRTPLNGLIGIVDVLGRTELHGKQKRYVELIKNSSDWLLNVISDGLDFTKIDADELVIDTAPVNIGKVASDICDVYKEVAHEKGLTFKGNVHSLADCNVVCDKNRLIQVLNNLLNNACKFTTDGQIIFNGFSQNLGDGLIKLSFSVEDTGRGIDKDNLEEIFSPFKQIKSKDNDVNTGTGLGLAISYRLVSIMGGKIVVNSELGVGSTFSFNLELPAASEKEVGVQRQTPAETVKWHRPPEILLVEDNLANQEVALEYLRHLGCIVSIAGDGLRAIELVSKNRFDLIFMDCQMPEMNGLQATKRIRSLENGEKKNIIIALTAHITEKDRRECFDAGMDDYVGKPYNLDTLRSVLGKWLNHQLVLEDKDGVKNGSTEVEISEEDESNMVLDQKLRHDLRNKLNIIMGGIQVAKLSAHDPEKCKKNLDAALKTSAQIIDIISNIKKNQKD